jgi:hypothetical protein
MVQAVLLVDARPTIKELRKELDRFDKSRHVPDPQPVQPIRKSCAVCGKTGVTLTAVKAEPDGTRLLLCKDHKAEWEAKQEAAQSAKASRTAGKMVQAVLLVDARPTFKAIQKELTRLADKPQGVGPKDAALLEVALEALRRA